MTTSFRRPYVVDREAPGHYGGDGVWVPGQVTQTSIMATVMPAALSDYERVNDEHAGLRVDGLVRVYTDTEMNVADPRNDAGSQVQAADVIYYPPAAYGTPQRYRIVSRSTWRNGLSVDHYRFLAALLP